MDGGAFFSPNGKKIVFRAWHPKNDTEIANYKNLLKYNLVASSQMELFTIDLNGANLKQITKLGRSNWAPYYLSNNQDIIFSSNFNSSMIGAFDLYLIKDDGTNLRRVYFYFCNLF